MCRSEEKNEGEEEAGEGGREMGLGVLVREKDGGEGLRQMGARRERGGRTG